MAKLLLIVNPKAGVMKMKNMLMDVISVFNENGYEVQVDITQHGGHATEIAQEKGERFDRIVAAGGDGTLNEVIAGITRSGIDRTLGYIPCGSTNDFASTLGLSADPRQAAVDIMKGKVRTLDVGKFNDRNFSYIASFGAFTRASYSTPQAAKNMFGYLAYVLEGMKELSTITGIRYHVETSNGNVYDDNYILGSVSNSTSVGGIISLDEKLVKMNDGRFELILVKEPKNIVDMNECINCVLNQNYMNSNMLIFEYVNSVTFTSDDPIDWTLDGEKAEAPDDHRICIENMHNNLHIVLPESTTSMIIT